MRRLLFALCLSLLATPAQAAIGMVNHTLCKASGSASSIACTVPSTTAGNLLVTDSITGGSATVSTVQEGASANFGQVAGAAVAGSGTFATFNEDVWFVASANGGQTTVTVNFSATSTFREVEVWEVSHTAAISVDGTPQNLGGGGGTCVGTDCTGAPITTTGAIGFVTGHNGTNAGSTVQNPKTGNAFTSGGDASGDGFVSLITSGAGTYTPVWTTNTSGDQFTGVTTAFKEAGGGGGGCTPTLTLLGVGRCG